MTTAKALAAVLLLGVVRSAIGAPACVDSSTQFFGAPWHASLVDAEQESDYKLWGDLVGAAVLFNKDTGCVQAVQGTYGPQVPSTSTLGLKARGSSGSVLREELQLAAGEVFDYVEYKADSCIAYLKLTTSEGRALAVGNADAELSLQSHRPAAGSYLGFFKATLEPLSAESAAAAAAPVPTEGTTPLQGSGALKQLQLVWVRDCATVGANEEPADPVAPALSAPVAVEQHAEVHMPEDVPAAAAGAAAADTDALSPTWGDHGSDEDLVTAEPPADPMAVQTTQFGSEDFGAGRDSSALRAATAPASCTAKQAVGFSDGSGSVPTSSCSLSGLGKEVLALSCFGTNLLPTAAADAAGALSPCANLACKLSKESCESSGAFGVGSFCTGKVVSMGATAKLHSVGESYIGYPCIEVKDIKSGLMAAPAAAAADGDYSAKGVYVAKSWKVCDCAAAGVAAQTKQDTSGDITITLPEVPMPRVTITTFPVEIKPPNFTLPSFHAKPFSLPANFSLPASLQALAKIANFTALDLDLPDLNFTLPSLPTLTADGSHPGLALLSSLPNMLKFDRPVTNMTLPDVLAQWLAATVSKATLPRIVVPAARVNALKALIPGFTAPSVVMPTTLSALLSKVPSSLELPSFSVPAKTLPSVSLLLPNLTSLPSIIVPAELPKELRLPPLLTMHNVSLPTFQQLARHVVDSLPSMELSFNVPDVLAQWVAGVVQGSPLQQLNVSDSGLAKLKELLPDVPDKGPALLLLNITSPFLAQPVVKNMIALPTVVIPDALIKNVSALLPSLTSLPSILLSKLPSNLTMLPEVKLPEIILPGLRLTINKILQDLPATLNMTQGITDWLDTHTSLLGGKAVDDGAAAATAGSGVGGAVSLNVTHPMVDGVASGLAAAVQQMAEAKAVEAPVKADVGAGEGQQAEPAVAAAVPAVAADAAPAAAAAAAPAPVEAVVAGAPIQEVEVKPT